LTDSEPGMRVARSGQGPPFAGSWLTDVQAGLTVALVALPQAIAYAMLAGIPPVYGLTTAVVAGSLSAALGRSPQVATGPTNTTGLLILGAMSPFVAETGLIPREALPALATLTLLAGAIRVVVALAGGAHLVRFLPESVLVGFTAGAGTLIGAMQLDEALGLPPVRATGLWAELAGVAAQLADGRPPALAAVAVTLLCVAAIVAGRRVARRLPAALLAVVLASLGAWALGLGQATGLPLVGERAAVPTGWPPVALPSLDLALVERFFVPACAIVLLGTLELAVSARAGGARPDLRREILAQGWANAVGAFAGAFPASASFTRSALLRLSGARTRLGAVLSALFVLPVLLFGAGLVGAVPQAALAGVLLVVAFEMVDRDAVRRLWSASAETRLLLVLTFVATLVLPIEWAILLGSGTGLVIHLANTSAPRLRLLRPADGRLVPVAAGESPLEVVLEVSGNLHYAAVPPFVSEAERIVPPDARLVVIDLSHAHEIRFTALRALEQLADETARAGGAFWLAGVNADTQALIRRSGSTLRVMPAEAEPGLSVRRCLEAAGS